MTFEFSNVCGLKSRNTNKQRSTEMFGNQQDTCLLHNSLLSALKRNQCVETETEKKVGLDDDNEAVAIVSSTVNSLNQGIIKTNFISEALEKQLLLQRRCHAAIFFTVLKSKGISCSEADKYYESIVHIFPTLTWKFYLKLNFQCKWSEYFVECCQELQPDILSIILKKILYIDWNEDVQMKYYCWHIVLQAIICKFFILEDSSLSSPQDCCSFAFPFVSSDLKTETSSNIFEKDKDSCAKSQLLHSFVTLLNNLHSVVTSSLGNFDFIKIVLHAYKTMFSLLLKVKTFEKNIAKELFRLNKLADNIFLEKQALDVIKAVLQRKDEKIPLGHFYAVTSWEISGNYLVFVLCNYWDDVLKSMLEEANSPCLPLEECLPSSSLKEILKNTSPLFKTKFEKDDNQCILSLRIIISLNYPCATKAAIILLLQPEVREMDGVLVILENSILKLDTLEVYPVLVDAITTSESKDTKTRLLNLFFKILAESSSKIFNEALKYILDHYGVNDHFRLHDFYKQLNCFTRKMMSDDEAEKCLLPLFVQSPRDVLKILIEQALLQGSNEITVMKVLKNIPIACLHSNSLIEELKPYFMKNEVEIKEMNHMTCLINSLMKIHSETSILDFDKFLQEIIVPNLTAEKKVLLTLECLNTSLNVLALNHDLEIQKDILSLLIQCMSLIIDKCMKIGDGRIKELAVTTLSLLSKTRGITDELKTELMNNLSSYSPSVAVYISKLFEGTSYKGTEIELDDSWWLQSCNLKCIKSFQEIVLKKKMSYEDLVSVLISVLSHLTKEEWFESSQLIGEYVRISNLDVSFSTPWLLPKSDPKLYAVIRCLMDSYYFTLKKGVYDLGYMSNCFTNTMQRILGPEVNLHLHLNVFLDICHLTLDNTDEVYTSFLPFLLTVKKAVEDECKDKHLRTIYLNLLHHSIKCLPNFDEKLPFFLSSSKKSVQ